MNRLTHVARIAFAAGLVAAPAALAGDAEPQPLPTSGKSLTDIIADGGSFIVDDKLFEIKAFESQNVEAGNLVFVPVNFGLQGVGFDILSQFVDQPGDAMASGFALEYNVTVLDPAKRIIDAELSFNGFAFGPNCFTDVNESIFDPTTTDLLATLDVFASGDVPEDDWRLMDEVVFGSTFEEGYDTLNIVKDFEIFACEQAGVGASFIRQTFSQIPTPGASVVLAGGLLAAAHRRR